MKSSFGFFWPASVPVVVLLLAAACPTSAATATRGDNYICPPFEAVNSDGLGPFDARDPTHEELRVKNVEKHHFNPDVEFLRRGQSSVWPGADIEYVLKRFTNHPRALASMLALESRVQSNAAPGVSKPIPCYFEYARAFAPDDPDVRLIYGIFLARRGKLDLALAELKEADRLRPDYAMTIYNLGLVEFERKQFDQSVEYARRAQALGLNLGGLRDKLARAGYAIGPASRSEAVAAEPK